MITYELNGDKDIFIRQGTIAIVSGADETAQDITTKFRTLQGEVFYDITFGVPYFNVIMKKPFDKDLTDTIMIQTIHSSREVTGISNFQSNVDTFARRYIVNFTATTKKLESIQLTEEFRA